MSYTRVLALMLFTMTTNRAGRLLLVLYALSLGAQPFAVGLLTATFAASPAALSLPIGMFADRFGSRWPLLIGSGGMVISVMVPVFFPGLPAIFIAAVMLGISFAFYNVTLQNLAGLLSQPHNRAQNFSNFGLVQSVAAFAGPLLVGMGIDQAGYGVTCIYFALFSLPPVVALAIRGGALPGSMRDAMPADNVLRTLKNRGLLRVLAISSLIITGMELFQFFMPIYGHGIGLSASAIGFVLAMFAAAGFVVRVAVPVLLARMPAEQLLVVSFCVSAGSIVTVPFLESVVVLALIAFLLGLGTGCGQPITMMLTFGKSAQGRSGEVMGLRITINQLTRVIVPIVFGTIGSAFGFLPVFWVNALMLAVGGVLSRSKNSG